MAALALSLLAGGCGSQSATSSQPGGAPAGASAPPPRSAPSAGLSGAVSGEQLIFVCTSTVQPPNNRILVYDEQGKQLVDENFQGRITCPTSRDELNANLTELAGNGPTNGGYAAGYYTTDGGFHPVSAPVKFASSIAAAFVPGTDRLWWAISPNDTTTSTTVGSMGGPTFQSPDWVSSQTRAQTDFIFRRDGTPLLAEDGNQGEELHSDRVVLTSAFRTFSDDNLACTATGGGPVGQPVTAPPGIDLGASRVSISSDCAQFAFTSTTANGGTALYAASTAHMDPFTPRLIATVPAAAHVFSFSPAS